MWRKRRDPLQSWRPLCACGISTAPGPRHEQWSDRPVKSLCWTSAPQAGRQSFVCVANKFPLPHICRESAEASMDPISITDRPRLGIGPSSASIAVNSVRDATLNLTMALAAVDRLVGDVGEDAVRRMRGDLLVIFPIYRHSA
jgi:hypothetical protein